MNWKNVLYLLRVERKSGRLIRGVKTTRYRERGIVAYWPYWVSAIIGVLGGLGANAIAVGVYSTSSEIPLPPLGSAALGFFITMPTLVLIFSIVFSMLQQIQMSGVRAASRVNYWLPITWQEQTLASILANLLGLPVALTIGFAGGLLVFAGLNGLILPALLTTLVMFAAAFMGSSTTEILRIVQVRFTGAVYKSSGRAAIWVRFIGSLVFFLVFYVIYFSITQGFTNFIQGLTTFQTTLWFVPFVWPGLILYYIVYGVFLEGGLFVVLTALFTAGLYVLAIKLNERFGLYEPPAIRVQVGGTYTPKTGILGKIGFSTVEAAIIRKDIRSFTRRRELIGIFIIPIVFIIIPLMQSIGITNQGAPQEVSFIFLAMTFLFSSSIMAMSLGNMLIGEEGEPIWRIYASPVTAKNIVKSKFALLSFFAIITLIITGTIGTSDTVLYEDITSNPTYFRDETGNWAMKLTVVKTTSQQFDWNCDLALYSTVHVTEETCSVEFSGTSDTGSWTELIWTTDLSFDTTGVTTNLQLYNYATSQYSSAGDGFITDILGQTDQTETQSITVNPTNFRDSSGNWRVKITGIKATDEVFDMQVDLIEYSTTTTAGNAQVNDELFNSMVGQVTYELPYVENDDFGLYLKGDSQSITNQSGASMTQLGIRNGAEHAEIFLSYRPKLTYSVSGLEGNRTVNEIRISIINLNASDPLALYGKLPLKISCQSVQTTTTTYTLSYAIDNFLISSTIGEETSTISVPITSSTGGSIIHIDLVISQIKIERAIV